MVHEFGKFVTSVGNCLQNFHQLRFLVHYEAGIDVGLAVSVAFVIQEDGAVRLVINSLILSYSLMILEGVDVGYSA